MVNPSTPPSITWLLCAMPPDFCAADEAGFPTGFPAITGLWRSWALAYIQMEFTPAFLTTAPRPFSTLSTSLNQAPCCSAHHGYQRQEQRIHVRGYPECHSSSAQLELELAGTDSEAQEIQPSLSIHRKAALMDDMCLWQFGRCALRLRPRYENRACAAAWCFSNSAFQASWLASSSTLYSSDAFSLTTEGPTATTAESTHRLPVSPWPAYKCLLQ